MREIIKNEIRTINSEDMVLLKYKLNNEKGLFIGEIDGRKVSSYNDYIREVQTKFCFPTSCIDNIDGYLDWIRDLSWLQKEGYVLIIKNFSEFLKLDPKLRDSIILDIEEVVLPFWAEEVTKVVVGGKAKSFKVYLVD